MLWFWLKCHALTINHSNEYLLEHFRLMNPLVESYQKTFKNGIHSFPAWLSAFSGGCGEEAGKFACCVLGQDT